MAAIISCVAVFVSIVLALGLSTPDRKVSPSKSLGQVGLIFNFTALLVIASLHVESHAMADPRHWLAAFDAGMGLACILAGLRRRRETA